MNNHFVLFSCCVLVKGASRSLIADTQRYSLDLIPNILAEILDKHQGQTIKKIISIYGQENKEVIEEYFQYLIEKEYIFFTAKKSIKLYPPISNNWEYPGLISNAIIDYGPTTAKHLNAIITALSTLNCKAIQIRFFNKTDISTIENMLALFDKSKISDIQLFITSSVLTSEENLQKLYKRFIRIGQIGVFNASKEKQVYSQAKENDPRKINYYTKAYQPSDVNYVKRLEEFPINNNLNVYSESQHFNNYFNKKLYIAENGDLKNSPHTLQVFGNIETTKIVASVNLPAFQQLWKVKKDDIEVCQDCEFRYTCVDPRIPIKRNENSYQFETPCNYDPYTASWENS